MGSMNDWPEFAMKSDAGEESRWTREVNTREQDALYRVGSRIEIDYVVQRHKPASFDHGGETKCVLEIRILDCDGVAQNRALLPPNTTGMRRVDRTAIRKESIAWEDLYNPEANAVSS
jgi:hypothetical protein